MRGRMKEGKSVRGHGVRIFGAVSILMATIIGAGIFGLPYVAMRAGFVFGIANMIFVFLIILPVYLYLGEIGLRTKTRHHLAGYAQLYLGKRGKLAMLIAFSFGVYASLVGYLIGESKSISFLIFNTPDRAFLLGLLVWLCFSLVSMSRLKQIVKGEKASVALIVLIVLALLAWFAPRVSFANLSHANPRLLFLPFGVTLFAFLGFASMPEVERYLSNQKSLTKRAVWLALSFTLVIYLIFTFVVVGAFGERTPEIATIALGKVFVLLGMLTMFSSYIAISIALEDMFKFDFGVGRFKAWLLASFVPLVVFAFLHLVGRDSFVEVIGAGGSISGGLTALLVLAMARNAKRFGRRKPEYSVPYNPFLVCLLAVFISIATILNLYFSFFA
ncbi:hypothetical protein D6817_03430 [Candidatus Pacearchaeota archaeon]|nr:MAG: hypothetical protein D6817_03430 [Candidatus Pacearchaeota archaeon]